MRSHTRSIAERAVRAWVGWYTRSLPEGVRDARRAELDSDLWEHASDATRLGSPDLLVALEMLERLLAGIPSDLSWRRMHLSVAEAATADGKERAMPESVAWHWWTVLAGLFGLWNLFLVSSFLGIDGAHEPPWLLIGIAAAGATLLLGGLWLRRRARVAGDLSMVAGAALGYASAFWLVPLILVSAAIAVAAMVDAASSLRRRPIAA